MAEKNKNIGIITGYDEYSLLKTGGFTLVKPPFVCYNVIDKYYRIVHASVSISVFILLQQLQE